MSIIPDLRASATSRLGTNCPAEYSVMSIRPFDIFLTLSMKSGCTKDRGSMAAESELCILHLRVFCADKAGRTARLKLTNTATPKTVNVLLKTPLFPIMLFLPL